MTIKDDTEGHVVLRIIDINIDHQAKGKIMRLLLGALLLLISSASMAVGVAKGVITFKGIPFDKPDVRGDVGKLCEYDGSSEYWCVFNEYGDEGYEKMLFLYMNYGHLIQNNSGASGEVTVNEKGGLIKVTIRASKPDILKLAALLTNKHGNSKVSTEKVANGVGTLFDKKTFVWLDMLGTRLTIESIHKKVDIGLLTIESSSLAEKLNQASNRLDTAAQNNL